jgi:ABC-type glycerol-3-phosphate transport system permease component
VFCILPSVIFEYIFVNILEYDRVVANLRHLVTVCRSNHLAGSQIVEWNAQMSGALPAALPALLVCVILGRYFVRGLLAGSEKT